MAIVTEDYIKFWHRVWNLPLGDGDYYEGPIRVTLNRGDQIQFRSGGQTDEGYSYTTVTYIFDYDEEGDLVLIQEYDTEGKDCDGRLDTHSEAIAITLDEYWDDEDPEVRYPTWEQMRKRCYRRDYTAEAMGY